MLVDLQLPFQWRSAAFRPQGGYWISRQDGRFPDLSQALIEQMYQKYLIETNGKH